MLPARWDDAALALVAALGLDISAGRQALRQRAPAVLQRSELVAIEAEIRALEERREQLKRRSAA